MKTKTTLLCLTLFITGSLAAQTPTIDSGGVVNVASYAYAGLPSGGIAQGSIFGIFGNNLGPTPYVQPAGYPIPTSLANVSVSVTSGGVTANAPLFLTSAKQITALLPSTIPVGTASLTVTANGATSAPASFQVVASSFGTFTLNSGGSGPGAITNPSGVPFGLNTAANPDEPAVIWGTGLAPVQGNEANGALPGDMPNVPVEVYVGTQKATVTYRGRSGCCAGLDQIVFTVPNVTGCRVSVIVKINSIVSNSSTLAIAPKGTRTCSDPGGPSSGDLQKYQQNGVGIGVVSLSRVGTSITVPFLGTVTTNADLGSASFSRYTGAQLDTAQNPFNTVTLGTCTVFYSKGSVSSATDPVLPRSLDAGNAITVSGPGGSKQLAKMSAGGYLNYSGLLSSPTGAGYLDAGSFTASGPGGPDVGGFSAQITVGTPLNWTNQGAITDITRASGQAITWTGGDANNTAYIVGSSSTGSGAAAVTAGFACYVKATDGQFTIPAQVLLALPVSAVVSGVPTGSLSVGQYSIPKSFTASGIDVGYIVSTTLSAKTLNYK